jgi:hypothetical protein
LKPTFFLGRMATCDYAWLRGVVMGWLWVVVRDGGAQVLCTAEILKPIRLCSGQVEFRMTFLSSRCGVRYSLDEVVLVCVGCGFGSVGGAGFGEDVGYVSDDCVAA